MAQSNSDFYSLSAAQFEEFVCYLLMAQGYLVTTSTTGTIDNGIDMIAQKDGRMIAIEIKHTKRLSVDVVRNQVASIASGALAGIDEWWLITSAQVSAAAREAFIKAIPKATRIIDGEDLRRLTETKAAKSAVNRISELVSRRQVQWLIAILTIGFSVAGAFFQEAIAKRAPLGERIKNVSGALESLKDLEKQLTEIKADMAETERARIALELEYSKAKKLEKLTAEQLAAIRTAVQKRGWSEIIWENIWVFFLGIGSSLLASAAWEKFTRWKSQQAE